MRAYTRKLLALSMAIMLPLTLGGCGHNTTDRVLSGAGVGAAAGAATYAIVGAPVATGILVGGAVGAVTGGVTSADNINLGKPFWRSNEPEPQSRNIGSSRW